MTHADLIKKINWFYQNPTRLNEPYSDTTAYKHLCKLVLDWMDSQPPERNETPEWITETNELHRMMSGLLNIGAII